MAASSTTAEQLTDDDTRPGDPSSADDAVKEKAQDDGGADGSIREEDAAGGAEAEPTAPKRTGLETVILMLALCMAVFLAALDAVIITTALPTIARELGATDSGYAWVAAGYLLASAAVVPFWGKVSDIFGRKPILMIANVVFLVGSIVAALAHTLTMLIAGRAVQGLGAGGLMALVNITVGDLFSPRERGMYFSAVGAVWGLASGTGTLIGGAFTENLTWRWCFWINLPISALSLGILLFFLKIHTPKTPLLQGLMAIDWLGTLTTTTTNMLYAVGALCAPASRGAFGVRKTICYLAYYILKEILYRLSRLFRISSPVAAVVIDKPLPLAPPCELVFGWCVPVC